MRTCIPLPFPIINTCIHICDRRLIIVVILTILHKFIKPTKNTIIMAPPALVIDSTNNIQQGINQVESKDDDFNTIC